MRVSKSHPVAGWLRVEAHDYSRALDAVLNDRDKQLLSDSSASGLPPASIERFWRDELPRLCSKPAVFNQVEARIAELTAKRDHLNDKLARTEREVAAERSQLDSELASLNQVLRT